MPLCGQQNFLHLSAFIISSVKFWYAVRSFKESDSSILHRKCPVSDLPVMFMLNEQESLDERCSSILAHFPSLPLCLNPSNSISLACRMRNLDFIGSQLCGSYSLWDHWSEDERTHCIIGVMKARKTSPQWLCIGAVFCMMGSLNSIVLLSTVNSFPYAGM